MISQIRTAVEPGVIFFDTTTEVDELQIQLHSLRFGRGQRVRWEVAVEKGTDAVISVNFSVYC